MKTKTRTVWLVRFDGGLEAILDRSDQFEKWWLMHNIQRIESELGNTDLGEYVDKAIKMFKNGQTLDGMYEFGTTYLNLGKDSAEELSEAIDGIVEYKDEFTIVAKQMITAIKI